MTALTRQDLRFTTPLYTIPEAARLLGVPTATCDLWTREGADRGRKGLVTTVSGSDRGRAVPFVGLVEGMVAAAFRRTGVSMQHIRKSLAAIESTIGLEHALASRRLYTDGAAIVYDYARQEDDDEVMAVVLSGQRVFSPIVSDYLRRITYATDQFATRLVLPITKEPLIVADPRRAHGRPLFLRGGAPMDDVIDRFRAGESLRSVARDFDLKPQDVEEVIRVSLPAAA